MRHNGQELILEPARLFGSRSRILFADQQSLALFLGATAFQKLADLDSDGIQHVHQLRVGFLYFRIKEFHDGHDLPRRTNRKTEARMQVCGQSNAFSRKVLIFS